MSKPLADLERLFKALADATRLRILGLLLTGEVCVCHIHESLASHSRRPHATWPTCGAPGWSTRGVTGCGSTIGWLSRPIRSSARFVRRWPTRWATWTAFIETPQRLQKKTGCCLPAASETPTFACCQTDATQAPAPMIR